MNLCHCFKRSLIVIAAASIVLITFQVFGFADVRHPVFPDQWGKVEDNKKQVEKAMQLSDEALNALNPPLAGFWQIGCPNLYWAKVTLTERHRPCTHRWGSAFMWIIKSYDARPSRPGRH